MTAHCCHQLADVATRDFSPQKVALLVLLDTHSVICCSFPNEVLRPQARVEHTIRVNRVYDDPVVGPFEGSDPAQLSHCRLRGAVCSSTLPRRQNIFRAH